MGRKEFDFNEKGKAVRIYRNMSPLTNWMYFYFDAKCGKWVIDYEWNKKAFEERKKKSK